MMQIFLHPWILLRRISVQAPRGYARVALAVIVAPCTVHAKLTQVLYVNQGQACHESDTMALILCADEVWRGRRSEFCGCGLATEQISHAFVHAVDEVVVE
ncbi:hypothetical protein AALO_G00168630 [Alosa alosa]|uniref:Secreted protein n=1 Tax=Alosa alosa TaxID=278164 RepID=A0AAV6GDY2_9TELE|nr:hypothetical protein AALO_G00168630 [Alosa alosa]